MELTEKYAPRQLADICGQQRAARKLTAFARNPKSRFFFFHGAGGVGKTTAARLLAEALGIPVPLGWDFHSANAATITKAGVEEHSSHWWIRSHHPWKVFVVENCDDMPAGVQRTFMTALDSLREIKNTVVIFTANDISNILPQLPDRGGGAIAFESRPSELLPHLRSRASTIWLAETGLTRNFADDELVPPGEDPSIRSLMLRLEDEIREHLDGGSLLPEPPPAEFGFTELRGLLGVDDGTLLSYFDGAGLEVRVGKSGPRGKNRKVAWPKVEVMLRWVARNRHGAEGDAANMLLRRHTSSAL